MKALKDAIQIYTNSLDVDGEHLSRCYHSLVQLVMGREEAGEMGRSGQTWQLINQILDLLESKAKVCKCMLTGWGPVVSSLCRRSMCEHTC